MSISGHPASARENARQSDGRFGEQGHTDPGQVGLEDAKLDRSVMKGHSAQDVILFTAGDDGGETGVRVMSHEDRVGVYATTGDDPNFPEVALSRSQARALAVRMLDELDAAESGLHDLPDPVVARSLADLDARTGGGQASAAAGLRLYDATQRREAALAAHRLAVIGQASGARYVTVTTDDDPEESRYQSARHLGLVGADGTRLDVDEDTADEMAEAWGQVDRKHYGTALADERRAPIVRPQTVESAGFGDDVVFVVDVETTLAARR